MYAQKRASGSVIVRCAVDEREEGRARTAGTQASVADRPDLHVYGHTRTESVNNRVLAPCKRYEARTASESINLRSARTASIICCAHRGRKCTYQIYRGYMVTMSTTRHYIVPDASTGTDAP